MALDYQPLFILSGGMLLQERKLAVTTNNLANMDTPSFKKDFVEVVSWYTDMGAQVRNLSPENPTNNFVYSIVGSVFTDFSQGSIKETGNPMDVAIDGDGFFAVNTPQGVLYTRKGNFRLDKDGYLITEEGYRVLDNQEREIRVEGLEVMFGKDGTLYVDGEERFRLGVWTLQNAQKSGHDFYTGEPQPAEDFALMQGFLEMSNVNGVVEMVRLIETSRAHETYARLIQAVDEIQGRVNTIVR